MGQSETPTCTDSHSESETDVPPVYNLLRNSKFWSLFTI